jgi:asparagine synthase (glutamine-hydrolysing)
MCGVAGVIGNPDPEQSRAAVFAMMASLSRRGPDGEGLEQWPAAVLGHRRLSIFDLSSAGRQPMLSADGQVGLVFNGAIYNFHELRAELERAGSRFRSQTDTEVLLHGYSVWGVDRLVARLRGMFAIALWDNRRQELYLIRDRLGVKPLLYSIKDGVLAFASTVRALNQAGFTEELDLAALAEFLEFGFVTDQCSIYASVKKVPPGTIVRWDGSQLTSHAYWSLPRAANRNGQAKSFSDIVSEAEGILREAVKIRLQADVPVGALLSGGIDSSLVCWAAASVGANIKAFTVSTPNHDTDESSHAVATVRQLGIPHAVIDLSGAEPPEVEDLVSAYGEPFACASALGVLRVSRAVKREATVLLTGDGGDDIFLGYPYHRLFFMAERVARLMPNSAASVWLSSRRIAPDRGFLRRGKHFLDYSISGLGAITQVHDGLPRYHQFGLLGERLNKVALRHRLIPWSIKSARNLLEEFLLYDWQTTFTGEYLTKVDGGTMFYGLEARSPFLDHVLWEYAGALPLQTRLHGGTLKAVLREIVRRRMGKSIADRPKRGFEIPVCRWLAKQWGNRFVRLFNESLLAREGLIRQQPTLDLWQQTARTGAVPVQLWRLFVLEHWMRAEFPRESIGVGSAKKPEARVV